MEKQDEQSMQNNEEKKVQINYPNHEKKYHEHYQDVPHLMNSTNNQPSQKQHQ